MDTFLKTLMHHITIVVQTKAHLNEMQKDCLLEKAYMILKYHPDLRKFPCQERWGMYIYRISKCVTHA